MIVISGVSGGIGYEFTKLLLDSDLLETHRTHILGIYHENKPSFEVGNESIRLVKADIRTEEGVRTISEIAGETEQRTVLVHLAARSLDGLVAQYKLADLRETLDVNVTGNFLLTKALLPSMIRMAWGRIIHFSSFAGVDGSPGIYAYAATKSAIQGMSRVLAKEYGRLGITSNVVQLGYFDSGLIETLSETRKAEILRNIPSRKFGETVNILNAFRFIIDSEYLNGASISLDGGL